MHAAAFPEEVTYIAAAESSTVIVPDSYTQQHLLRNTQYSWGSHLYYIVVKLFLSIAAD